jgi:hypothetical protein
MQEACMQLNRGYEINWASMPLSLARRGAKSANPAKSVIITPT